MTNPTASNAVDQASKLLAKGLASQRAGRFAEAEEQYERILKLDGQNAQVLTLLGSLHVQRRDFLEAIDVLTRSLKIDPRQVFALATLGDALIAAKRCEQAAAMYDRAVALQADDPHLHLKRGDALRLLKRYGHAVESYDRAIALEGSLPNFHFFRALALQEASRLEEALAGYDTTIGLKPDLAEAHHNRANVLYSLQRHDEALAGHDRAIAINPSYAQAHGNRGNALKMLGRHAEALASLERAIALKPDYAAAHNNKGNVLRAMGRYDDALASYHEAIALRPGYAEAYNNRGLALRSLRRDLDALASYDKAIALKPDGADAHQNRATVLKDLGRFDESLASIDKAIALQPDNPSAHYSRAVTLKALKRFDEALTSVERTIVLDPMLPYARGLHLWLKMHLCDWRRYAESRRDVLQAIERGEPACQPFMTLALDWSLDVRRRCAEAYARDKYPPRFLPSASSPRTNGDGRIRIAYLSADYRTHPMPFLMMGVFELHDRKSFEVYAISFARDDRSEVRARLERAFDHFVDVRAWDDRRVAEFLNEKQIDIVIDLMGYTDRGRPGIFALRAAPVQINYLGFPGTLGSEYHDYIIADKVIIPPGEHRHYSENVVYLPETYLSSDPKRRIGDHSPSRADLRLPADGFVFCGFHNSYKIAPDMFDVWMRILRRTEGSVLWLLDTIEKASLNLRREAEARGVSPERLVFAPRLAFPEHLARHQRADLFLDMLPYGAHTSASDSLFVGVPVLTCRGQTFTGRVAASVLHAIGLPEMVTESVAAYEALAIELARDPGRMAAIRAKLARNRHTHPAFDTVRFTRHLERAYTTMFERRRAGAPPIAFDVEPIEPTPSTADPT